mmetsp:Transcript_49019/g.95848  ORF Transcript_49019/g.95848 Transcript_49019/m.95848 type:complete len:518 (+) Transcript_49019:108-1661(+)
MTLNDIDTETAKSPTLCSFLSKSQYCDYGTMLSPTLSSEMSEADLCSLNTPLLSTTASDDFGSLDVHDAETADGSLIPKVDENGRTVSEPHSGFIGMFGSISLAYNNLVGPGIVFLPAAFQRSGIIPTTLAILFVSVLSAFSSLHMANVISKVPGNLQFRKETEYSEAFRYFGGEAAFYASQIIFFLCVMCQVVASIVDVAQVSDQFFTKAYALQFSPEFRFISWSHASCLETEVENCIPFHNDGNLILTGGYLISAACFLPLGMLDLKENMIWQMISFILTVLLIIQFIFTLCGNGLSTDNVSFYGESWGDLVGVILFNNSLCTCIPAWLYEKKKCVSVSTVVWSSSLLSAFTYISFGLIGAFSINSVPQNILQPLSSGYFGKVSTFCASSFAFMVIGLGIPLFCVVTRLNLVSSGLLTNRMGILIVSVLPWVFSWMLYQGGGLEEVLAWGGLLLTGVISFIAPTALALYVTLGSETLGSISLAAREWRGQKIELWILLTFTILVFLTALVGEFMS